MIINIYRHLNTRTPYSFFHSLFSYVSNHKYALLVGDFNAHHPAWDSNDDRPDEFIFRAHELTRLLILNDGASTRISPPGSADSVIDLTIATQELSVLYNVSTETDSCGSDHCPISITINETAPCVSCFVYKLKLNSK